MTEDMGLTGCNFQQLRWTLAVSQTKVLNIWLRSHKYCSHLQKHTNDIMGSILSLHVRRWTIPPTFDPLRSEEGRAALMSSSMSSLSLSPNTTIERLKPRVLLATMSSLTRGIVFGVQPANLYQKVRMESHQPSQTSRCNLCTFRCRVSTQPDHRIVHSRRTDALNNITQLKTLKD